MAKTKARLRMKRIEGELKYFDCLEMIWMPIEFLQERIDLLYEKTRF